MAVPAGGACGAIRHLRSVHHGATTHTRQHERQPPLPCDRGAESPAQDSSIDEYQLLCTLTATTPGNATFYMDHCNELWACLRSDWDSPLAGCTDAQLRSVRRYSTDFMARLAEARVAGKTKDGPISDARMTNRDGCPVRLGNTVSSSRAATRTVGGRNWGLLTTRAHVCDALCPVLAILLTSCVAPLYPVLATLFAAQAVGRWWHDDEDVSTLLPSAVSSRHEYLPCELGSSPSNFQCNPTCPNQGPIRPWPMGAEPPQYRPSTPPNPPGAPYQPVSLRGKSIYFILVDRFARTNSSNSTPCDGSNWCGGTLRGLASRLDYVVGMGFDCVWITPVVGQYPGRDGLSGACGHAA
eukprot:2483180-Prymnesium_polylepis.2